MHGSPNWSVILSNASLILGGIAIIGGFLIRNGWKPLRRLIENNSKMLHDVIENKQTSDQRYAEVKADNAVRDKHLEAIDKHLEAIDIALAQLQVGVQYMGSRLDRIDKDT